jgi:ABC-type Zn2+ transport system substrate-binding protein/surface adhesin
MKISTILILAILGMFLVINVIDAKKHKEEHKEDKERDDNDEEDHEDKEVKRNNPDLCKRRENCHECLEVRSSSYSCTWLQSKNATLIADKCVNSIVAENELTTVLFEVFDTKCKKDKPKKKHGKKMAVVTPSPSSQPIS